MSRRTLVNNLKSARVNALGIGTRALKFRLKRLAETEPIALAAYLAWMIEEANTNAKRWGPSYAQFYYREKQQLINELITLFTHQEWEYGVHKSDTFQTSHIIYFEIPGCEQISWHCTPEASLPTYEKLWDGKRESTLPKLLDFIEREFPTIKTTVPKRTRIQSSGADAAHSLF